MLVPTAVRARGRVAFAAQAGLRQRRVRGAARARHERHRRRRARGAQDDQVGRSRKNRNIGSCIEMKLPHTCALKAKKTPFEEDKHTNMCIKGTS